MRVDALLRVREFTDDVISRVLLNLCLLGVRFIAHSSVKVDAQIHWCNSLRVWYHSTLYSVSRLASRFLRWHTPVCLKGRMQLVRVVVFAISVNTIQFNVVLRELNNCALPVYWI